MGCACAPLPEIVFLSPRSRGARQKRRHHCSAVHAVTVTVKDTGAAARHGHRVRTETRARDADKDTVTDKHTDTVTDKHTREVRFISRLPWGNSTKGACKLSQQQRAKGMGASIDTKRR